MRSLPAPARRNTMENLNPPFRRPSPDSVFYPREVSAETPPISPSSRPSSKSVQPMPLRSKSTSLPLPRLHSPFRFRHPPEKLPLSISTSMELLKCSLQDNLVAVTVNGPSVSIRSRTISSRFSLVRLCSSTVSVLSTSQLPTILFQDSPDRNSCTCTALAIRASINPSATSPGSLISCHRASPRDPTGSATVQRFTNSRYFLISLPLFMVVHKQNALLPK